MPVLAVTTVNGHTVTVLDAFKIKCEYQKKFLSQTGRFVRKFRAVLKMVVGPPAGAARRTCQITPRCFFLRVEVLSSWGKGILIVGESSTKEVFQMLLQDLNVNEPLMTYRN